MKKTLTLVLSLALAVAIGIGGTLAWLTATVSPITNTFTFNQNGIQMTLAETFPDNKLIPGAALKKEPVLTVKANSEPCYVYAEITNGFTEAEASINIDTTNWILVEGNVYRYKDAVTTATSDTALPALFTTLTVSDGLSQTELAAAAAKTIVIDGYAIQSNGGMTIETANAAAVAYFAS